MHVRLRNERTGELKEVKVGFSFTLFFLSQFLGVPLFLRKLNAWGATMAALCLLYWFLNFFPMPDDNPDMLTGTDILFLVITLAILGLSIFLGVSGNEMTAKHMLENGWEFADQEDQATEFAKMKWSLA